MTCCALVENTVDVDIIYDSLLSVILVVRELVSVDQLAADNLAKLLSFYQPLSRVGRDPQQYVFNEFEPVRLASPFYFKFRGKLINLINRN